MLRIEPFYLILSFSKAYHEILRKKNNLYYCFSIRGGGNASRGNKKSKKEEMMKDSDVQIEASSIIPLVNVKP